MYSHGNDWPVKQNGVYDISDFIGQHPGGGKRIMLAAGGSIDKFWSMYAQHQKGEVRDLLEVYRIGSLVSIPRQRSHRHILFTHMVG